MLLIIEYCAKCHREMLFMEGPICDPCIDKSELLPKGTDKWAQFKMAQKEQAKEDEDMENDTPLFNGRILLQVDLETKRVLVYNSPEKKKTIRPRKKRK